MDFNDTTLKLQWCKDLVNNLNTSPLFVKGAFLAEYRADIPIPGAPPTEIGFYPMVISQKPPEGVTNVEAMVIDVRTYTVFFDKIAVPTFTYAMALESAVSAVMQMVDNWAHFRGLNMQYGVEIGYQAPNTGNDVSHSGLILA